MIIPDGERDLVKFATDVAEICRASQGQRAAAYRQYGQWIETGRAAGGLALANMLYAHVDRKAGHLFSPADLRFAIDFENHYGKEWLSKGEMAARVLTREWERRNIDLVFGAGVREALAYGSCIMKLIVDSTISEQTGTRVYKNLRARLVMPWQFGVYNESVNDLGPPMEAMCETVFLNKHEVWRRIAHLDDAAKLYARIMATSDKSADVGVPTSFMHQVLSTAILDVSLQNATQPQPGGIVQLANDPSFATLGPTVAAELIAMHELTVWDDSRGDWTTIQMIEPDIVLGAKFKRVNLFCPDTLQYVLIQPNQVAGYFWGRSDIVDLMQPQAFLTTTLDDIKRIFGQQVDKLLAFPGYDGLNDELYGQFRSQGYIGMPQGSSVTDLTPKMPENALGMVNLILEMMEKVAGFPPILSGQGEAGVRAGVHADTLSKNASPRLRDQALLVERQCAEAGDATLSAIEAKDPAIYWTQEGQEEETSFHMSQLPDDRRVSVDSHTSSPIYQDDHQNLTFAGLKVGIVDPITAIEELPFRNKDTMILRFKEREAQKMKMLAELKAENPEAFAKALGVGGHKGHK